MFPVPTPAAGRSRLWLRTRCACLPAILIFCGYYTIQMLIFCLCLRLFQKILGLDAKNAKARDVIYCCAERGLSESAQPSTTRTPMGSGLSLKCTNSMVCCIISSPVSRFFTFTV